MSVVQIENETKIIILEAIANATLESSIELLNTEKRRVTINERQSR